MSDMKKYPLLFCLIISLMVTAVITSCNKNFTRVLPNEKYLDTSSVSFGERKVLYLIVDGARGNSVQVCKIPNINALLPHSIYSWVALNDPASPGMTTNWADLLTGVKKEKHRVFDSSFTNTNLQNYPVLFKRVKENNSTLKIASFSSSLNFKTNLTSGTDISEVFSADEQTKTAVVNNLITDTASFVVGHFTDIDKAGAQSGYDTSFARYTAAIVKFDGYVGEIMDALKKRPTFLKEDWLVVIASSGGGNYTIPLNQNDNTVFSNTSANAFTIYYNAHYKQRILVKPFTGNRYLGKTVKLSGTDIRAQIDTADNFNIDDTTNFTIELKVKKTRDLYDWPTLLSKRNEWSSPHQSVGWTIYLQDKYWFFEWHGSKDDNYHQCQGGDLEANTWKNLSVKCETRGTQRFIRTYTNGVFNNEYDITTEGSFSNTNALKLGYLNGSGNGNETLDAYISDIRFFKFTLPDATISRYSCETSIDESHPYYMFLVGYWPGTDGQGNAMKDLGPQARDFMLQGNYQWENFNDLICPPSDQLLAVYVPQTTDIPAQIITWFKIASQQSWDLDGRVWLDQ